MTGIDPTFIRIGFVAAAIFISFKLTLIAYAAIGIYLAVQKKKALNERPPDERLRPHGRSRRGAARRSTRCAPSSTQTDRRLMAIDHHINTQNDELAREIEALRQEEK